MTNYHVIKVTYLGATNRLGSRVKLTSERFEKDSVTMCLDHRFNSSLAQAVAFLSQCEFAIVGTAEGRGCYYIITSSFKRLTRG